MTDKSLLECTFLNRWRMLASDLPEPIAEYRFAPPRRFRFDFAWPDKLVAVELQGGIWMRTKSGRSAGHAYGKRMERDYEKLNLAQSLGWTTFYFTSGMLERDPVACIGIIRDALRSSPEYADAFYFISGRLEDEAPEM